MRAIVAGLAGLLLLSLTACGSKDKEKAEGAKADDKQPGNILTLPITAPMAARRRLIHDMDKNKNAARERKKQFDSVINGGR